MNLKQFKYVLTIAEVGTISKAAEELNISQPSLSQYVKKIETQLDVELFDRTNGNCRLTDAGRVYVETARQILSLERQMQNNFIDIRENKTGSLTIGTTPFRSVSMMPAIVAKFKESYPGLHIVVVEQGAQELKESAERGEFDLCIVTLPVDKKIFKHEIIMEEELVIAVPKGSEYDMQLRGCAVKHADRRYDAIDAKVLDGKEFIMVTEAQIMQKALNDLCRDNNIALQKAAVVKSLEAQIEMVGVGIGAALVPTGILKYRENEDNVTYYSLVQELPKRKVAAIYRKDKPLSKVVMDLIDDIKEINW